MERQEFRGTIKKTETEDKRKLIYEFNLQPFIKLDAPPEFQVTRGTSIRVPIAAIRSFYQGKIEVKAENLPAGVTATATTIEAGKNDGTIELKATNAAVTGEKLHIKFTATGTDARGSADLQMEVVNPPFSWMAVAIIGIWTALLAVGLCLALVVGQNWYLGRPLLAGGRIPLIVVVAGAAGGFRLRFHRSIAVPAPARDRRGQPRLPGRLDPPGRTARSRHQLLRPQPRPHESDGRGGGGRPVRRHRLSHLVVRSGMAGATGGRGPARLLHRSHGRHRRGGVPAPVAGGALRRARDDRREPGSGAGESRRRADLHHLGATRRTWRFATSSATAR